MYPVLLFRVQEILGGGSGAEVLGFGEGVEVGLSEGEYVGDDLSEAVGAADDIPELLAPSAVFDLSPAPPRPTLLSMLPNIAAKAAQPMANIKSFAGRTGSVIFERAFNASAARTEKTPASKAITIKRSSTMTRVIL
jgi:hypothetical protein